MKNYNCICVGTGEIGKPLYELISGTYETLPIDLANYPDNSSIKATCDVMHVCIPGDIPSFGEIILEYTDKYKPSSVIIHSTVVPGTTAKIAAKRTGVTFAHSPVHGKHHGNQMKKDMLRYPKYVGSDRQIACQALAGHLKKIGFCNVIVLDCATTAEWSKIFATTAFGLMIAYTQEMERVCEEYSIDFDQVSDVLKHLDDIKYPIYPGIIGGHCVMPNIELIDKIRPSDMTAWIKKSNELKKIKEKDYS